MERREFLKKAGLGAAALGLAAGCKSAAGTAASATSGNTPASKAPAASGTLASSAASGTAPGQVIQNYPGVGLLGYGCMRWPLVDPDDPSQGVDQEKVDEMVSYAMSHGVNYFDSAPVYLGGQSEEATAAALSKYPRESYLIATKLSNFRSSSRSFEEGWKMYQRSLEIYNTDYIDYYLLHSVGNVPGFEARFLRNGLLDALVKERELGHIRHLGFSAHCDPETFSYLMDLHPKYKWDFVQIQMNYIDWNHAGKRNSNASLLYSELEKRGIPVVIMEPLLGGELARVPGGIADELKSREPSRSVASWAFRFCGSFPKVLTVLSGMSSMDVLEDNVRTFSDFKPLGEDEFSLLERAAETISKYKLVGCTACQYCMPCPYGINIPGIFRFYNDSVRAGTYVVSAEQKHFERERRRYLAAYGKAVPSVRQADHCIGCGQCLEKCPQHINIPVELRKIDRYVEKLKQGKL